jgi:hypothetical protein
MGLACDQTGGLSVCCDEISKSLHYFIIVGEAHIEHALNLSAVLSTVLSNFGLRNLPWFSVTDICLLIVLSIGISRLKGHETLKCVSFHPSLH